MSLALASLHVYPIKSLGGFSVPRAQLTDRGPQHDRRWMLVDADGRFLSQREVGLLACLHTAPAGDGFQVTDVRSGDRLDLPWALSDGPSMQCSVWDDVVAVRCASSDIHGWFSERVGRTVRLVYMPDDSCRATDANYSEGITSLSDGFPYLIISQASLDALNERLPRSVGMERFRPNLVIAGGAAFQEDTWTVITVGTALFRLVKPCARCVITTTDQRTGIRGAEPLRTLSTFRSVNNKVLFGMNAVSAGSGSLRVGDRVEVIGA